MTTKGRTIAHRRQDMQSKFRENVIAIVILMLISLWVMMMS